LSEAALYIAPYPTLRMELSETRLIAQLAKRDEAAFEQVFKTHFKNLHAYACSILKDEIAAEEMVQNVFCKIWERADTLSIGGSLAAYLYRAVNNESLNHLKHQKVKAAHALHVAYVGGEQRETPSKMLQAKELESRLHRALNDLPEQCRTIFQLSRFEELRYREIADRMGLSVKTVENQMGKALRILREKLADLLPLVIWVMLNFFAVKSIGTTEPASTQRSTVMLCTYVPKVTLWFQFANTLNPTR
jgi:RNA polymerase sigma-70 factor, ECF subfamily